MKFFNKGQEGDEEFGIANVLKNHAASVMKTKANSANQTRTNMKQTTNQTTNSATPDNTYGIQNVIELMQALPDADPEVMMPIVVSTLQSAKIDVSDIILDASQREETLEGTSVELISNIEALESQITDMNSEIMAISENLDSITNVKNLLMGAFLEEQEEIADTTETENKSKSEDLLTKLNLSEDDEIPDELLEQLMKSDADFEDMDIDQMLNEVDKIKLAQEA